MGFRRYIIRRVLQVVPIIFFILVFNFILIRLAPGDPALALAGDVGMAPADYLEKVRQEWGLDKPLHIQLVIYFTQVLHGNLGYSYAHNLPVLQTISEMLLPTLLLVLTAQTLGIIVGVSLAVYSTTEYPSKKDTVLSSTLLATYSMPGFWFGLLMIYIFAVGLRWFPSSGMTSLIGNKVGVAYVLDLLWHLCLPVLTLTFAWIAPIVYRITRASLIEVMGEDFVMVARAMGLSRYTVFFKYVLRNALLPTVTMIGLWLGLALTSALMTETVFQYPGLGKLMFESIMKRDYPVLMGLFLIVSICVVVASFLTDVICTYLDPRIVYK